LSDSGKKKVPASYCFAQQKDNSCHIIPFLNLSILNNRRNETLNQKQELNLKDQEVGYTKLNWLPQTFLWTRTWDEAMANASQTAFGAYQQEILRDGVISGHVYDASGNNFFESINPVQNQVRLAFMPYNFTDAGVLADELRGEHISSVYKTLPIFWDKGEAILYDPIKQKYVKLKELTDHSAIDEGEWDISIPACQGTSAERRSPNLLLSQASTLSAGKTSKKSEFGSWFESTCNNLSAGLSGAAEYTHAKTENLYQKVSTQKKTEVHFLTEPQLPHFYKLTPEQKKFLGLPDHTTLNHLVLSSLGHEMGFKYRYLPQQSEVNSYYMSGLLQLMLFCMGVDNNNKMIELGHPLYEAHRALQQEMQASDTNPWALPSFKKENLLEYHIAKMIQNDPVLKNKIKKTVDLFFPEWFYYNQLDNLYDSPDPNSRRSLKDKKKYLLGEDLFLAYAYASNLRYLWAAATSRKAFNAVLEIDPIVANLMRLPLAPGPNQLMRNAQLKTKEGYSFLDVWKEIQTNLVNGPDGPKELASFSGHGVVMSFYPDLIEQQKLNGLENPQVMKKLNFALIDSYYGEQLSPMYRDAMGKENPEACNLQALTSEKAFKANRRKFT
jgi:hypothetical protein